MTKTIYQVRWKVSGEVCSFDGISVDSAKRKGREMSLDFGSSQMAELYFADGVTTIVRRWGFEKGKQVSDKREAKEIATPAKIAEVVEKIAESPKAKKQSKANHEPGSLFEAFDFRGGGNRNKLLGLLYKNFGNPVSEPDCMKAVFGEKTKDGKDIKILLQGFIWRIRTKKLPYSIVKSKVEKVAHYALTDNKGN